MEEHSGSVSILSKTQKCIGKQEQSQHKARECSKPNHVFISNDRNTRKADHINYGYHIGHLTLCHKQFVANAIFLTVNNILISSATAMLDDHFKSKRGKSSSGSCTINGNVPFIFYRCQISACFFEFILVFLFIFKKAV